MEWLIALSIFAFVLITVIIIINVVPFRSNGGDQNNHNDSKNTNREYISSQESAGIIGENTVSGALRSIINSMGGYLFDSYTFKDADGYSSEIDHILITRGGVFVIETKSLSGSISGSDDDDFWIQVKDSSGEIKEFPNPVRQNQKHINHLRKMFKNNPPKMQSIVVFLSSDIDGVNSKFVYDFGGMKYYIKDQTEAKKYSEEYPKRMWEQFESILNQYGISKSEHVANVREKYKNDDA